MEIKRVEHGDRTVDVVGLADEPALDGLVRHVRQGRIRAGALRGRGTATRLAVSHAPAGAVRTSNGPVSIVTMSGDVIVGRDGEPDVVLRIVAVDGDGTVLAGTVADIDAGAMEIVIEQAPSIVARRLDPESGVAFADLAALDPPADTDAREGVDEAVAESFPASDPPGFAGVPRR